MDDEEMNTNEAALQIGIPAKKLRGYIRADVDNLGVAQENGRWIFTARDVARLRQVLNPRVEKIKEASSGGEELTPYQKLVISRKDKRINKEVMERHGRRQARLEKGMRRAGLYEIEKED